MPKFVFMLLVVLEFKLIAWRLTQPLLGQDVGENTLDGQELKISQCVTPRLTFISVRFFHLLTLFMPGFFYNI